MAKITVTFSPEGMQKAIKAIEDYQEDIKEKCKELCRRLSNEGMIIASANILESTLGNTVSLKSSIDETQAGCKAILTAVGKSYTSESESKGTRTVNTLLLIEFGAGIHYNKEANPKAQDFGMGVGTFPNQTHAFNENGWFFLGSDNKWHHSYGVKATMPMFRTAEELKEKVQEIAREVFGG